MTESNRNTLKATRTTFSIVETISERGGAGVTELANDLNLPKSTVQTHLNTLHQLEFLVKENGQYRISLKFLGLGENTRQQMKLYDVAKPEVDELAEKTDAWANLYVEEHALCVCLYSARGENAVHIDTYSGKRDMLHCTAAGKAILANLPDTELERIIDRRGLTPRTNRTITDEATLRSELEQIRDRGVAFDDEENNPNFRCVAAPIITDDDEILGSISVSGPKTRFKREWYEEELPEMIIDAASVVNINMTYS